MISRIRNQTMKDDPVTQPSLLLRIRDPQDSESWRQFVEIYTPVVYRSIMKYRLHDADAADVSQEVMQAVARAIHRFDYDPGKGTFRGWLYRVVRSKLSSFFEIRQRHVQGSGETQVQMKLEAQPGREEEEDWNRECEKRLFQWAAGKIKGEFKKSTWEAFWQTAVENRPKQEVAESLGISVDAVYVARSRVMARLKARVQDISDGPVSDRIPPL